MRAVSALRTSPLPRVSSSKRRAVARVSTAAAVAAASVALVSAPAHAQSVERSDAWDKATTILALSAGGLQLVMPRTFFSDPEVTVGWKARWHLSVLAPLMTLTTLALINEHYLKDSFATLRPGCNDMNQTDPSCSSYAMFSTQSLFAFSAVGQGAGVFFVDSFKWSGGRINAGAFVGQVGAPLVLAVITAAGRSAGNWESGAEAWESAGVGLTVGFVSGLTYAIMQRPECGYSGSLLCW